MSKRNSKKVKTLEKLLEEALVPEEEQPYKVPLNWVWTKLGYVISLEYGKGLSKKNRVGNSYPVFGSNGLIGYHKEYLIEGPVIVIGRKGSIGEVNWCNDSCWPIDTTYYVKSLGSINYRFLYYLLSISGLNHLNRATAIPGLNREDAYSTKVAIPPFLEQERIVNRVELLLDKINEAKELIEEARETFAIRRAAILAKAFRGELTKKWREENPDVEPAEKLLEQIKVEKEKLGSNGKGRKKKELPPIEPPYELPKGWCWVRLGNIVEINPPKMDVSNIHDEQVCTFVPMSSIDAEMGVIISPEERPFMTVKKGYTNFLKGDVLFAKITPCMENGKCAIANHLINNFGYGSTEFHVIRSKDGINNKYVYYLVRTSKFRAEAKTVMTGAVGQQRVPKDFLEEYLFPLPPEHEQNQIVKIIEHIVEIENKINEFTKLNDKVELLISSVITKALHGQLGTNEPNEESALDLLKEVLKEKAKGN